VRRLLTLRNPDTVAGINAPNATNATLATWRCRASEVKARSSMSVGSKQAASASHTKMQNHTSETVFTALMFDNGQRNPHLSGSKRSRGQVRAKPGSRQSVVTSLKGTV
jgi:hypothetical protein